MPWNALVKAGFLLNSITIRLRPDQFEAFERETGWYAYSSAFKCYLGSGCRECGGLGATWDSTDYADMADYLDEGAGLKKDARRSEERAVRPPSSC